MKQVFRFVARLDKPDQWVIEGAEHTHLTKVVRLKVGDRIEVTNGVGHVGTGTLIDSSAKSSRVQVENVRIQDRPEDIILCIGALQSSVMDELVAPLVELGLTKLIVFSQESVAKRRLHEKVLARWSRISVSACKQSKRAWFPEIATCASIENVLPLIDDSIACRLILSETSEQLMINQLDDKGPVVFVIGGEKGLDLWEIELLKKEGFVPVKFCDTILRARTAAISAMALVAAGR